MRKKKSALQPRKKQLYDEEDLKNALKAIDSGISVNQVSKSFNIPRSTLQFKHQYGLSSKGRLGAPTYLTLEEERTLVNWIHVCASRGFPQTLMGIRQGAASIMKELHHETSFKNELPSYKWVSSFINRHPELTSRKPERLAASSATVCAEDLIGYHFYLETFFEENGLKPILECPERIVGGDETSFEFNPIPKKIVTSKGTTNVLMVDTSPPKTSASVMHTVSRVFKKRKLSEKLPKL